MRSLLITGALGHLGVNFITSPAAAYFDKLVLLDKVDLSASNDLRRVKASFPPEVSAKVSWVLLDMCALSPPALASLIDSHGITHVLHAAASTHVDKSYADPLPFIDNNIKATTILLEATKRMPTLHVTYMSTDEVYGGCVEVLRETALLRPTNPYAASKASVEMMISAYNASYNTRWLVLRPNNMAGPWQPGKVTDVFFSKAMSGLALPIHGDGEQVRDYIVTSDLCKVIMVCMDKRLVGVFNVASSNPSNAIKIKDLARSIIRSCGSQSSLVFVGDRPYNDHRYRVDDGKLRQALQALGVEHATLTSSSLNSHIETEAACRRQLRDSERP